MSLLGSLCEGISGVYDIAAHYQHEAVRGVEDVSTMARAMYGPKRFDRFSPTLIIENLPQNAWSVFISCSLNAFYVFHYFFQNEIMLPSLFIMSAGGFLRN